MRAPAWLAVALTAASLGLGAPAAQASDCCTPLAPPSAAPVVTLPKVSLIDQKGKAHALPDGQTWVVTFFYGSCKDVCPTLLYNLGNIEASLPEAVRSKVRFGAVSFDPKRDTPAKLAEYAENFEFKSPRDTLFTGAPEELERMFKAFGFSYKVDAAGDYQHVNMVAVLDRQGRIVRHFYGLQPNLDAIGKAVRDALATP